LTLLVWWQEGHLACKKLEWWSAGVVVCLERSADLRMAQLLPLPLTASCFSKMQTGFTFLVPAHLGSPGQRAVKRLCVCVCVCVCVCLLLLLLLINIFCNEGMNVGKFKKKSQWSVVYLSQSVVITCYDYVLQISTF